jgi:hypothetical protein
MKKFFTLFVLCICFATLKAQVPTCTTNLSPANISTNVSPTPYITLKWVPVSGATSYKVYLQAKVPPTKIIATVLTDTVNFYDADYNQIYYWYVVPVNASGSPIGCGDKTTLFVTSPPPPAPFNDDCAGATDLSTLQTGTTLGATQSQAADPCGAFTGSADDDVWYKISALSTGTIDVTLNGDDNFDGVLEVFKGDCGALTNVSCSDVTQNGGSEHITINALEGTNYKVRVYSYGSNLSDRGGFTISAVGSALPISLLSFKGEHIGNNNVLTWSTATEINNQGFEIQYSFNGKDFRKLGFVNSQQKSGNSSSVLNYEYVDSKVTGGNLYYRLMQVDKDGRYNYSKVILIKGDKISALSLDAVYPNPAKDKLNIVVSSPANNNIHIVIYDLAGKEVQERAFSVINGGNNLDLNVNALSAGTYFIKAVDAEGNQAHIIKFVKE